MQGVKLQPVWLPTENSAYCALRKLYMGEIMPVTSFLTAMQPSKSKLTNWK